MTTKSALDPAALARLAPLIQSELRRQLQTPHVAGPPRITAVLRQIFVHLCGQQRSRDEQLQFLAFAAPIAREIATESAAAGLALGQANASALDFDQWFRRLDSFDPICTRMVELYYFGGLSTRETAAVLGISPHSVVRELRFAKAWWVQAQLRRRS
jgi:DNA-directed RNA polymerase specialized sigma24 family protein